MRNTCSLGLRLAPLDKDSDQVLARVYAGWYFVFDTNYISAIDFVQKNLRESGRGPEAAAIRRLRHKGSAEMLL